MVRDPSHIFLSGATGDFQKVRIDLSQALTRGLCKVTHQESFPQTTSDTLLKLAQLIEPCGILIHMIGESPGSIPTPEIRTQYMEIAECGSPFLANRPELRDALGDFSSITYTQWEAYIAIHLGKPLFVYADANHASRSHPQRAHLDRLQGMARFASPFEDDSSLHRMVMADLMAHFAIHPSTREIPSILKPSNLPGDYIGRLFLGRDEFLKTLRQSLLGHGHATAITEKSVATGITGLGGIGKTHAAVEYAHLHREDYTALLFASADTPQKLQSSLATLCEFLHLDESGNLPPYESVRVRAALHWLASHSGWLLILDNVDDEPAAKSVQEILGQLTSGHILFTSRLHGWSDQVRNIDLEVLSEAAAAELLLQLTANRRRLASDDVTQARQLAILLEGLPLAIHQAAGYINEQTLTLAAYAVRYEEESGDLLNWFNDLSIPYERPDKLAPKPVLVTWKTSFEKLSEEAETRFRESLRIARVVYGSKHPIVAKAINNLAFLLQDTNRTSEAKSLFREALSIDRANLGEDHPDLAKRLSNLATLLHDGMCFSEAEQLIREALRIDHATFGENHEQVASHLNNLAQSLKAMKRFAEAEPLMREALSIDRAVLGDDHPDVARDLNNLGRLLHETNRLSEAEPLFLEALRIERAASGDEHPNVARVLNNLAQLLQATNRLTEAEPLMRDALRIDCAAYGKDHPTVAIRLNNLAGLLIASKQPSNAEPLMREALRILHDNLGPAHPKTMGISRNLDHLSATTTLGGFMNQ